MREKGLTMSIQANITGYPSVDKPWLKYYSEEAIHAKLPEGSMYDYIWQNNKEYLDNRALNYFGNVISYRVLFEMIEKAASAFSSIGVKKGDIVTICSLLIPETIYSIYALNKLGAIVDFQYVSLSEKGFRTAFLETETKLVITIPLFANKILEAAEGTGVEKILLTDLAASAKGIAKFVIKQKAKARLEKSDKFLKWKDFIAQDTGCVNSQEHDDAVLLHTGGTTGTPKGVLLQNSNFNALAYTCGELGCEIERSDTILHGIPPFHSYGFGIGVHIPLSVGGSIVMCPVPSMEMLERMYKKNKPEYLTLGITQLKHMLQYLKTNKIDSDNLKFVIVGGEKIPSGLEDEAKEYFEEKYNASFIVGYGMSELASVAASNLKQHKKKGSIGVPYVKNIVKIIDENGNELKYNEVGEICINSPTMMKEYYKNPVETNQIKKLHADGIEWIHTGDLGTIDEDGFMYIQGRIKRIYGYIDDSGNTYKIFPDYIENTVSGIEGVKQCAAGCIKEDKHIHKIYCFISLEKEEGIEAKEGIKARMKELLPDYDYPHFITFVDTIPSNAVGKVDYLLLEKMIEENSHAL